MPLRQTIAFAAVSMLLVNASAAQVLPCVPAATSGLTDLDPARMSDFVQSRTRGLAAAMIAPSAADREVVSAIYAEGFAPAESVADGNYSCRTIKMGGLTPLIVYGAFDCTISDTGTTIEKTTGSQRFKGTLVPSNGGQFYRGALHYSDEQPVIYNAYPERDQVGCLYEIAGGGRHLVLELPSPQFESLHDLIVMVPK